MNEGEDSQAQQDLSLDLAPPRASAEVNKLGRNSNITTATPQQRMHPPHGPRYQPLAPAPSPMPLLLGDIVTDGTPSPLKPPRPRPRPRPRPVFHNVVKPSNLTMPQPPAAVPNKPAMPLPPAAVPNKPADLSSPSSFSFTTGSIKRLYQQLVQIRALVSSRAKKTISDDLISLLKCFVSSQPCFQDLHYQTLLAIIGRNQNNKWSDAAGIFSKQATSTSTVMDAKIHALINMLDIWLRSSQLCLPGPAGLQYYNEVLEAEALVAHCILFCRGVLGIMDTGGSGDAAEDHQVLSVSASDDLNYSRHDKITRMNAHSIPSCVADPIYLLPAAIRSLLYLDLSGCSDIAKLPSSLGSLHNLSALNLSCCWSLQALPESIASLRNLQILLLFFCHKLYNLPVSLGYLSKLRLLDLSGCSSLEMLPDSLVNLCNLENLNISDCSKLKGIPQPFGNLQKLEYLNFSGCHRMDLHVEQLCKLVNLKCITVSPHTDIRDFPNAFHDLRNHLDMSRWRKNNWVHPQCNPKATSLQSYRCRLQNIIDKLLSDGFYDSNEDDTTIEQSLNSICIVGESGLGKTELIHEIYNNEMILEAFDLRIWICMHDKKTLLEKIIEFTTCTYCSEVPLSILEETVRDELTGKRFLLVLDDADIESQSFLTDVQKLANIGEKGSAVIVSTRSKDVANLFGEMHTYYLSCLSQEECFMIFQDHVSCGSDVNNCSQLANVGWKIVEKCGGNALAVKALSGLLCHSEIGLFEIGTLVDGILPVLGFCYDLLPAHLKQCFKYCSLFPKYYVFIKHHIVRLWISQGFIYPEEDCQPEDTGLQYFNELFCRSFFQRSPFDNDQGNKFVMHELFHDLARSVSRDECLSSEEPFCSFPENIRHLSLVHSDYKTVVLTKEHGHLQSLLITRRPASRYSSTSVPVLNILGLKEVFMKCGYLRALNLSSTDIIDLPSSIGNMKHLRFLALNNTKIKSLPIEIGQIDTLQTLELTDCCYLIELPESTKNLTRLRHLDMRKEPGNVHVGMPSGLGQLTDLQTLAVFNIGNDLLHCSIGDLKDLNGLRGHVHITGLQNIKTGADAKLANLIGKNFLEVLTLEWCYSSDDMEDDNEKEIVNQVLQNLQPNKCLQELVIRNYSGNLFPFWMQDCYLCMLVSVTIDDCQDCNELPYLGDLLCLKYLSIQRMYGVESFGKSSNSVTVEGKLVPKFPSLEILNLWDMYSLQFWKRASDGDFPRLRRISISRCPKLTNLPPLVSLEYLSFHCGDQLPACSELPSLKSLKIEGFQKLKSVSFCAKMSVLKKLEISDCKELLSVNALLLSVSHLKVVCCPKLHSEGISLEGCLMWETLQRGNRTVRSLLVKALTDDGWTWRKYGQKDIFGPKYQRSYFRCHNKNRMGCRARKTVELKNDDPIKWLVTYISEHNHRQAAPCNKPSPDLLDQLGTTRKRKEFDASNDDSKSKKQFSEQDMIDD